MLCCILVSFIIGLYGAFLVLMLMRKGIKQFNKQYATYLQDRRDLGLSKKEISTDTDLEKSNSRRGVKQKLVVKKTLHIGLWRSTLKK